jgi:AraC-like DNA-binding protein
MIIRYDTQRLNAIIKNLFDLTGISISILDQDYRTLTNCSKAEDFCTCLQTVGNERERCMQCDGDILKKCSRTKNLERHICMAGLYDSAMPIMKYDTIVGYVLMGRIRSANSPESLQYIPQTDACTIKQLKMLYGEIPTMAEKQLNALYQLLPLILFDNAIRIIYDPLVNEIVAYIREHLKEDLNVRQLCGKFHISVNYLYNLFRKNLDCSVCDYITEQRMNRAKELIASSELKIYAIAEAVGIDNYTYFCRVFKKRNGCSPTEYRKIVRN